MSTKLILVLRKTETARWLSGQMRLTARPRSGVLIPGCRHRGSSSVCTAGCWQEGHLNVILEIAKPKIHEQWILVMVSSWLQPPTIHTTQEVVWCGKPRSKGSIKKRRRRRLRRTGKELWYGYRKRVLMWWLWWKCCHLAAPLSSKF